MNSKKEIRAAFEKAGIKDVGRIILLRRANYLELRIESERLYWLGRSQDKTHAILRKINPSIHGVYAKAMIASKKPSLKNKTLKNGVLAHFNLPEND